MEHSNAGAVEGKLFLYENPEMLALEDHEALGITPVAAPYANTCLLYTSPSPRDQRGSRMPSSA